MEYRIGMYLEYIGNSEALNNLLLMKEGDIIQISTCIGRDIYSANVGTAYVRMKDYGKFFKEFVPNENQRQSLKKIKIDKKVNKKHL